MRPLDYPHMHLRMRIMGSCFLLAATLSGCAARGNVCEDSAKNYPNLDERADLGLTGNEFAKLALGTYDVVVESFTPAADAPASLLAPGSKGTLRLNLAPQAVFQIILSDYVPCESGPCNDVARVCFDRQVLPLVAELSFPEQGIQESWTGQLQSQRMSYPTKDASNSTATAASYAGRRPAGEFQGVLAVPAPPAPLANVPGDHHLSLLGTFESGRLVGASLVQGFDQRDNGHHVQLRHDLLKLVASKVEPGQ